jgi:hypothetical protein
MGLTLFKRKQRYQGGTEAVPSDLPTPPEPPEAYQSAPVRSLIDQVRQGILPDEDLEQIKSDPTSLRSIAAMAGAALSAGTLLSGGEGSPREGMTRLYRVEPTDFGDSGAWLQKHMPPERYQQFLNERGRGFSESPKEEYGHGAEGYQTYYVDVPHEVAKSVMRMNTATGTDFPEYLLPPEYVSQKQPIQQHNRGTAMVARGYPPTHMMNCCV